MVERDEAGDGGDGIAAPSEPADRPGRLKRWGGTLLATVLLFMLLEGGSSLVLAAWDARRPSVPQTPAMYDPFLGWVNTPSAEQPDFWGAGRGFSTNARGVRGREETPDAPPPGRVRVLCSGDSFAFGEGVGDEATWCHLLSVLDPRMETVNLGQPGYGVDQAYLRFEREGLDFGAAIHLFTFTGGDFNRMGYDDHYGYAKPVLELEGGRLTVQNVPAPRVGPAISRAMTRLAERLRSVELGLRALGRILPGRSRPDLGELERVAEQVFREVRRLNEENGGSAVFVYLPGPREVETDHEWRAPVHELARRLELPFIDLTDDLRALPPAERRTIFLPEDVPAGGHYSEEGNAWAAGALHRALLRIDEVAERLAGVGPGSTPDPERVGAL